MKVAIRHTDGKVGARIAALRKERGLSLRQIEFPGCSAPMISRVERGARIPSVPALEKLAERLGTDAAWLAGGDDAPLRVPVDRALLASAAGVPAGELAKIDWADAVLIGARILREREEVSDAG